MTFYKSATYMVQNEKVTFSLPWDPDLDPFCFPFSATKMEAFWNQIALALSKKSENNCGNYDCTEWRGALEHGLYGKKSVTWPDGSKTLERTHRLSYMLSKNILRVNLPHYNENGEQLDVSHLCHNPKCIKPEHLTFEPHSTNLDRIVCRQRKRCTGSHLPLCIV